MKKFLKTVLAVIVGILLFNLLLFAVIAGLATPSAPVVPAEGVLKIDMSKIVLGEQTCDTDPLTMLQSGQDITTIGIWDAVQAVNTAAEDPGIKYIYLKTDGNATGIANASEFRKALQNFRANSGKAIVSYVESPSTGSYYLSSVADKIYMTPHPGAMITVNGVGSQMFFLSDLLKKFA